MPARRPQKPAASPAAKTAAPVWRWWAVGATVCLVVALATLGYHQWALDSWQKRAETTGVSIRLSLVNAESAPSGKPEDVVNMEEQTPTEAAPKAAPATEDAAPAPSGGEDPAAAPAGSSVDNSLKDAPVDALAEVSPLGVLPKIATDGTKPWHYYARPFARPGKAPMIAIIVTGLGANQEVTDAATQLNPAISLSFSPYAKDVTLWAQSARRRGHEALIDLPMESSQYPAQDPGPYALLSGNRPEMNEERLRWLMSRFPGYIGFVSPPDEVVSRSMDVMRPILQSLNQRGLMLVVGKNTDETGWVTQNLPALLADKVVDLDPSIESISNQLDNLEKIAKERGVAIGITHAYPLTLHTLKAWSESVESRGIVLAPVSALARMKFS